jgi:ComF family protein
MSLADVLARPLLDLLKYLEWEVDLIAPVPIGASRRSERGYNQAALLALPLALGSGIPYRSGALKKLRDTRSQVGLSRAQRRENVAGAFTASEELVQWARVLVVDDVMTSGATIESCAQALKEAGADQVFGLTLAQVVFEPASESMKMGV